ncbi:carbohydrate kinase family protein [Patescibacteria group bacterium]
MNFDVVCVGSALLDVYMKSDKFIKVTSPIFSEGVALCEVYGGKTEISEAEVTSGGGGTNNAVSFARKGLKTGLIAEMGTDLVASFIKLELEKEGVDTSMLVQESGEETGISSIMVANDGGRSVAVHRGASKMLTKEDVLWDRLNPKWIYISSLGGEMALLEGLIGHAKSKGIKVAVNPGMSEIEKISGWGGMKLFEGVDVLLVNRQEATKLSGIDFSDESVWQGDQCIEGPKICVITDGSNAGRVFVGGVCKKYEVNPINAVEQTGAGDGFGSALVAALILGKDVDTAILWAKKQSASVVSHMGPKKGLLTLEQLS